MTREQQMELERQQEAEMQRLRDHVTHCTDPWCNCGEVLDTWMEDEAA